MDANQRKSDALAVLLSQTTNMHFMNPRTRKIDLSMLTRHMHEKDANAEFAATTDLFDDSSDSDNIALQLFTSASGSDAENASISSSDAGPAIKKKRKNKSGSYECSTCNGGKIKNKHRCSSWFRLRVDGANPRDQIFFKRFQDTF